MRSKQNYSFFRLLLGNYIIFTLVIAAVLFMLFGGAMYFEGTQYQKIDPEAIMRFSRALSAGNYNSINVERVLGKGGYITILTPSGKLVYSSDNSKPIPSLTADELELIEEYDGRKYYQTYEVKSENENQTVIVAIELKGEDYVPTSIIIADNDNNIIFQTPDKGKKKLTDNEYTILTQGLSSNYRVTRFDFINNANEKLILLTYAPAFMEDMVFKKINGVYESVFISFLLLYCVIILIIVLWMNSKVKKPLSLLQNALTQTANGNLELKVDYQGPKEFVEICNCFNDMSNKLSESEQARLMLEQDRRKMIANISHDLKTPITVIQGYANAVNDGIIPPEKQAQYLNTIAHKADMLNHLIDTFHAYSKLEHPNYAPALESTDICVYLRDYMATKYDEFELCESQLKVDIPEIHVSCRVDRSELRRVFENIISNFFRYNEKGATFYCKLEPRNKFVRIILADNGPGIPEEIAQTIFDPFMVGEESRSKNGSGLGLAIAKKIIVSHGGSISLVQPSYSGYKTQFEVILPIID